MNDFLQDYSALAGLLIIGSIVLYIAIAVAILKLPRIARYQLAQTKLLALMAKEKNIPVEDIQKILLDSDKEFKFDATFEEILTGTKPNVVLTPQGEVIR